jgi:hypothetical protein
VCSARRLGWWSGDGSFHELGNLPLHRGAPRRPRRPGLAVNYGLALLRSRDWRHGYQVLSSVVSAAPPLFKGDALAAIAVCLAHLGDYTRAAGLLEHAAATMASPDGSIADADLPTVPVWVTYDQELQPRDNPIGPVIDEIIGHLPGSGEPVPSSLLTLSSRRRTSTAAAS